jgi:hypothetical protein
MKYVPPLGAADPNASYHDGNPEAGILGSIVPAAAIERPQREILSVLAAAGIVPSDTDNAQLAVAISALILAQKIKLTDRVNLTDSTTAASATAVKTAYDAAQAKLPLGGGVMTGSIQINDPANVIGSAPSTNTERGLFLGDKNSVIMGGFDIIQHASDNAKRTQMFAKNASGAIASIAAVTHEDGTREISTDCPMRLSDVQIERLFADSVRLIKFSGAHGNEGLAMRYSPDSGELYLDGRAVHGKADSAGYADTAGSANALGGKAESALSVAFASEAQNAFGLKGMDMIIARTTHTLPNYGTWKYMYLVATDEKWIDMVIGESPGGTTLTPNYPGYPDAFMDGMAFRSA